MRDLAMLDEFSNKELEVLVDLIVDKGWLTEMLSIDDAYKKYYPNHKCYVKKIKKELLDFGSNNIKKLIFSEEASYRDMLMAVCKKTKTPFNAKSSLERIENALLEKILTDTWDKISDAEKAELLQGWQHHGDKGGLTATTMIAMFRTGGFVSYQLSVIIANTIAKTLIGRGLPFVVNAALTRGLSILSGPVGLTLATVWTIVDIAGPAYRVTIPAVIYIAALRQVHQFEQNKKEYIR